MGEFQLRGDFVLPSQEKNKTLYDTTLTFVVVIIVEDSMHEIFYNLIWAMCKKYSSLGLLNTRLAKQCVASVPCLLILKYSPF